MQEKQAADAKNSGPESPCLPLLARKYVHLRDNRTNGLLPYGGIITQFWQVVHIKIFRNFDKYEFPLEINEKPVAGSNQICYNTQIKRKVDK